MLLALLLYNLGRIMSYTAMGALLGGLVDAGIRISDFQAAKSMLFVVANLLMIALGFYFLKLSWLTQQLEGLGRPVWRVIQPWALRMMPIKTAPTALLAGLLWGWMPCGLVYTASLYALASGSATQGAMVMLVFGLGTLPNLVLIGLFAKTLKSYINKPWIRYSTGLTLIGLALYQLCLAYRSW
jgi:sulfite exporter TauE/SafE